jgi:hypothetical protein
MNGGVNLLDALVYIFFSTLEGLVIMYCSLSIFRVNIKIYFREAILTSIMISCGTYFYIGTNFESSSVFINAVMLMIAYLFIFRISLLPSIYIPIFGFVAFLVLQGLFISIISYGFNISLEKIKSIEALRYFIQVATDLIILSLFKGLEKRRICFTFVPFDYSIKIKRNKANVALLISSFLGAALLGTALRFDSLIIGTLFWIVGFVVIVYVGYKKEMEV